MTGTHYGSRACEIDDRLRMLGFVAVYDMPGEGFTLETPHGEPIEYPPAAHEEARELVDELERITTN